MPQRQRNAGSDRHLATLMVELGWSAVRVRDLTRGAGARVRSPRPRFSLVRSVSSGRDQSRLRQHGAPPDFPRRLVHFTHTLSFPLPRRHPFLLRFFSTSTRSGALLIRLNDTGALDVRRVQPRTGQLPRNGGVSPQGAWRSGTIDSTALDAKGPCPGPSCRCAVPQRYRHHDGSVPPARPGVGRQRRQDHGRWFRGRPGRPAFTADPDRGP